jgi:hypothetical protein
MEPWYTDPDKLGWIAVLGSAVAAFYKGTIMPTRVHEADIKQLRDDFAVREAAIIKDFEARLQVERERANDWKDMAVRGSYVARDNAAAAKEIAQIAVKGEAR